MSKFNFSRLTPVSRAILSATIVCAVFFLIKIFIAPKLGGGMNNSKATIGSRDNSDVLLTLSGSSTLGSNMIPQIAKQFMSLELNAQNIVIKKINDKEVNIIGRIDGDEKQIVIKMNGSIAGLSDLQNQKADLAMLSGGGDNLTSGLVLNNIALDWLAVIVNKTNKVNSLTKTQVKDIFSGKITNWSQVGGDDSAIKIIIRDPTESGIWESFKQLTETTANLPASASLQKETKQMLHDIENAPQAIGLTSSSNIGSTRVLSLSDEGTQTLYPSPFSIQTEDYIFTRRLYLVNSSNNTDPLIKRFIAFCQSDEKGQKTVAETGFVNLNLHNTGDNVRVANAPPQYLEATNGAVRLPTTLHFHSGSAMPDEKTIDDMNRIMNIVLEPQNRQKQVILIGFTDNTGNPTQNLSLSTKRAQSIQAELAKFGLQSQAFGFGQALPIATNTTASGQNKNRRVEAWLK